MNSKRWALRQRRRERGVALMVALVMLVIIGIASVSIMRGALSSDLIANNTRVQTLAMQAAQIGLRYCEDEAVKHAMSQPYLVHVLPDAVERAWETLGNWGDADKVNDVPSQYMESDNSTFVPGTLPQCMVQQKNLGGQTIYEVTARGFSPDYAADEDGSTASGSVVWLQSLLRI
jgi:type IV pilus assembly protein PilX